MTESVNQTDGNVGLISCCSVAGYDINMFCLNDYDCRIQIILTIHTSIKPSIHSFIALHCKERNWYQASRNPLRIRFYLPWTLRTLLLQLARWKDLRNWRSVRSFQGSNWSNLLVPHFHVRILHIPRTRCWRLFWNHWKQDQGWLIYCCSRIMEDLASGSCCQLQIHLYQASSRFHQWSTDCFQYVPLPSWIQVNDWMVWYGRMYNKVRHSTVLVWLHVIHV